MDSTWIQTYTGKAFYPLAPRVDDICIEDIAHGLAMKCRYNGQSDVFFSVAQHSVLVSRHVPAHAALWGLLHDAAEAYLPDVPRPIKSRLVGFQEVEDEVLRAVATRFGLSWPMPPEIKRADIAALATEKRDLLKAAPKPWNPEWLAAEPWPQRIWPMLPSYAEQVFLHRYKQLTAPGRLEELDPGVEIDEELCLNPMAY